MRLWGLGACAVLVLGCARGPDASASLGGSASAWPASPGDPGSPASRASLDAADVAIRGNGLFYRGQRAGSLVAILEAGRPQRVQELYDLAKAERTTWAATRPGMPFHGQFRLELPKGTTVLVLRSAILTMGFAGFVVGHTRLGTTEYALSPEPVFPPGPEQQLRVRLFATVRPPELVLEWRADVLDHTDLGPAAAPEAVSAALPAPRRVVVGDGPSVVEALRAVVAAAPPSASAPLTLVLDVANERLVDELVPVLDGVEALRAGGRTLRVELGRR